MSEATLKQQFEAQRAQQPDSPELARLRRSALDAFTAQGFPTRRDEAWHYTDLKPIADGDFDFTPAQSSDASRAGARALLEDTLAVGQCGDAAGPHANGLRAVFVDGRLDDTLSQLTGSEELEIVDLAAHPQRLGRVAAHGAAVEGYALAALNTAFARDGVAIRTAADIEVREPLHVVFIGSGVSGQAQQPRVSIDLARNSSLTVVVHCLDAGASANWLNLVTQVTQAEGSRLALYRLQEHGEGHFHTSLLSAEIAKDAAFELGYVDLGGRLTRNDIDVRLVEPGASATLFGVFLASDRQHIDNHIRISHVAPRTISNEIFRGIADGNGRGVFNGKIVVHRDAQRIDARQSSDNLLLSDKAEIDTKPELEIYADDVKCSHGATVGELDPGHLFYLRSRGLDEEAARGLLTFAFANSVLRRLAPEAMRKRAAAKVAGYLSDQSQWEDLV